MRTRLCGNHSEATADNGSHWRLYKSVLYAGRTLSVTVNFNHIM